VSATDVHKYDNPPGLQDNGEIIFSALGRKLPFIDWFLRSPWSNAMHFLGAVLCLAFSALWDQVRATFRLDTSHSTSGCQQAGVVDMDG